MIIHLKIIEVMIKAILEEEALTTVVEDNKELEDRLGEIKKFCPVITISWMMVYLIL